MVSESNFQPDYDEEDKDEDSENESINPEDSASQAGTASQVRAGKTNVKLEILNKFLVQQGVIRAEADACQGLGQYKTKKSPEGLLCQLARKSLSLRLCK